MMNGRDRISSLNGIFSIWKPSGDTSSKVIGTLKSLLTKDAGVKLKRRELKIGHGGTLDKAACGVLSVGIGKGTKKLGALLHSDKRYRFNGVFGTETDTLDINGNITRNMPYEQITEEKLREVVSSFIGKISQVPPIFSALKVDGNRLSDLARASKEIPEIKPRDIEIYSLNILEIQLPHFSLEMHCGSGTYVRSLVRDIAKELDTCAHVTYLERTQHGPFTSHHSINMENWNIENIQRSILESDKKYHDFFENYLLSVKGGKNK